MKHSTSIAQWGRLFVISLLMGLHTAQANDPLQGQKKAHDNLQAVLKSQEMEMGNVSSNLKKMASSLAEIRQSIQRTEQEIARLEKQEAVQRDKLAQQLDSAYRSDIHPSLLERLLSDTAKDAARKAAYYEHLNQLRIQAIVELRRIRGELNTRKAELLAQQNHLQQQLREQKKQENTLQQVTVEREKTIQSIDKTLESDAARQAALKENERDLLAQAAKASNFSGNGLGNRKYAPPVSGKLVQRFGQRLTGDVTSHNQLIQAPLNTPVRSLSDGIVENISWVNGYGNVVTINHGANYVSYYGHLQSVMVSLNEPVSAGQQIATVGQTGGQKQPALYFSIRHQHVAVDPAKWLK